MKFDHTLVPQLQKITSTVQAWSPGTVLAVSPLTGVAKSLLITELNQKKIPVIVLCSSTKQVMEREVELTLLGLGASVVPVTDLTPEVIQERLTEMTRKDVPVIVAEYGILRCNLPKKKMLEEQLTIVQAGASLQYSDLIEYLNELNYQQEQFVDAPGSYCKRGAIVDFWSYSERMPVRLEFDGDFIESLRLFDPESQRSIEIIEQATLAPPLAANDAAAMQGGILDYFPDAVVLGNDTEAMNYEFEPRMQAVSEKNERQQDKEIDFDDEAYDIPTDRAERESESKSSPDYYSLFRDVVSTNQSVRWVLEHQLHGPERLELELVEAPAVNSNYKVLFSLIRDYCAKGFRVIISAENSLQADRMSAVFDEAQNGVSGFVLDGSLRIITVPFKEGFVNKPEKLVLLSDYQIFNKPYRTKLPLQQRKPKKRGRQLEAIRHGDFVVHEEYGIGRYMGLESITIGETEQESMKLQYSEGGIVYVNLNYLHLVKKYSAKEGVMPTLSTLGTMDWSNKKKKARKKIREAAKELITLYAKRKLTAGYSFAADTVWQQELEASFIYEDTADQAKVTAEVKADMEAGNPMDRLVCGDVGFGKTEIAVRAAFKAVQDGKQVAVLVPTTILAEQHYNTLSDRLSQFPVKIAAMSRFQTKAEQTAIAQDLKEGKVDIIVGTHRILSKDIGFRDLGLLIIDEEHRFGVTSKEKLRSYKLNVDVLTMTATPIPRTLNLSLLGARDLSLITTPPPNRQPVITRVEAFENAALRDWIMLELKRGGQVYIVHDRIQSIEMFANYIRKRVPEAKIGVAHGRMKPQQLEDIFHGFLHRKYDILLATKIIESGLDIPNTNTIIINRADRFGLAELHQLRGRVGRSDRQAYAYLLVPALKGMQKNTTRRLQAIEENADLGAGFQLSMRDLEIRGAGNLLGNEQTGFINEIGFDLYIKLINETVEELKQEEFREIFKDLPPSQQKTDTTIEAYFEIGIPKAYIPDQMDRLSYYTALYGINGIDELKDLTEEIIDRFGTMPMIVKRLLKSAELKFYAGRAFFERVIIQQKRILIVLPKANNEDFYQTKFARLADLVMGKYRNQVQLEQKGDSLKLSINQSFQVPEKSLEYLLAFAKEIARLYGTIIND